ncbi:hypothetical protein PC128_g22454 [Phytophthora cactorum]|nr:hypothetical protein PC120_g19409 [Phytophthora cactorum]KAG3154060.1 hypothetical protein PC128_g22454 [Phytophthora cactorum]
MASSSATKATKTCGDVPFITYENGDGLMEQGVTALLEHIASTVLPALGQPKMEIRFRNVSICADIVVKDKTNLKTEPPTLVNVTKTSLAKMAAKTHIVKKNILRNVSGVLKPGTMTLVLGQPGSGKSSLLKVLSVRFPTSKRVRVDGQVTYNGTPQQELQTRLPQFVSFVDQHDKHFPRSPSRRHSSSRMRAQEASCQIKRRSCTRTAPPSKIRRRSMCCEPRTSTTQT